MIKFSIIVPIYNAEKYLSKCLDSLVNQTFNNIEIILINDGSKDNSEKIILNYANKYSNIIYLKKENGGQATARNMGLLKAQGEFISFIDSDDYVSLDMYEILNKNINNNIDIIVFDFFEINKYKNVIKNGLLNWNKEINRNFIISPAGPWNKIYRRSLLEKNQFKFLENHIYEDLAVIPTLACTTSKIIYINIPLYYYIIHPVSTMNQKIYNKKLLDIFPAIDNLYNEFIKFKKIDDYIDEIEYVYIENLLHGASLRFLKFKEGKKDLNNIVCVIFEKFPNWRNNRYYKKESWKYKLICNLLYMRLFKIAKILLMVG